MDGRTAKSTVRRAANSDHLEKLARIGLIVYGSSTLLSV